MLEFYRDQRHPVGIARTLLQHANAFGPRLYLSLRAQLLARGALSPYGIHEVTDLVFLGLNPINGYFKSVSMDRIHPSLSLMHGAILGQSDVIDNKALLDVLGIGMVLTTEQEGPLPSGLQILERIPVDTFRGHDELVLMGNPDAWPAAAMLPTSVLTRALPLRDGCGHEAALCRQYESLRSERLPTPVTVVNGTNGYSVRMMPADRERLLFLSATYRGEWIATSSAGRLRIDPVAGAFLGVTVPPGVQRIELSFVPRARIALSWVATIGMIAVVTFLSVGRWRRRAHSVPTTVV
jgi:hypothetical protein